MQMTVESVKATSTGKSLVVKAGGKDYFAKTTSGLMTMAGHTIEAETKDSVFNGKTNTWIEKWAPVQAATQTPPAGTNAAAFVAATPAPWLPFASNTVAHAISNGLITAPAQIEAWTRAAKEAFFKVNGEI